MDLPRPFEVLEAFGGKSKSEAPRALKFCAKGVPIEVNNWWKFGVDIFNQLWDIQIWKFFFLKVPPTRYKNNFQKLLWFIVSKTLLKSLVEFVDSFLFLKWRVSWNTNMGAFWELQVKKMAGKFKSLPVRLVKCTFSKHFCLGLWTLMTR